MQLNNVVFPAPECSYSIKDFPGQLIYVPRYRPKPMDKQQKRSARATGDMRMAKSSQSMNRPIMTA